MYRFTPRMLRHESFQDIEDHDKFRRYQTKYENLRRQYILGTRQLIVATSKGERIETKFAVIRAHSQNTKKLMTSQNLGVSEDFAITNKTLFCNFDQ
ncbi:hypothetical protein B5X24_HaOG216988 [Helicoverpa armigera]|uniref:Uncharacterized protein n=1 Tax=Helicoverpa armigera TaxID=29058 RepID=A0A2W1C0L5_HELAM|nr:hypothetical protein B5X24_HaOG216988 [Helicoverpa armigera]